MLDHYGIRRLDGFIISHFDWDHMGALATLLESIKIDRLYDHGILDKYKQMYLALLDKKGIPRTALSRGDLMQDSNIRLTVLSQAKGGGESENNRSVVLRLDFKQTSFLFTGDIEYNAEAYLLADMASHLLDVDVLKVAHHGSKTSSSALFLHEVSPILSLISCGRRNRYGHPATEVVERLMSHSPYVFSTPQSGAIEVKSNGKKLYYRTYL